MRGIKARPVGSVSGVGDARLANVIGDGSGNVTTTSTTYTDLTGMSVQLAAAAGDVLKIQFQASVSNTTALQRVLFRANVGGTDIDPMRTVHIPDAGYMFDLSLLAVHTVTAADISGGLVTVKIRWATNGGTASVVNDGTYGLPLLTVTNHLIPPGDGLVTESGDTLTTESGDTLIVE